MSTKDRVPVNSNNLFGYLMSLLYPRKEKSLRQWCLVYSVAVAATVATLFLRIALGAGFEGHLMLVFFIFPIILSSYLGGLGPGLVATLLSAVLVDYFLISPLHSFAISKKQELGHMVLFIINGVFVTIFTEVLHRLLPID